MSETPPRRSGFQVHEEEQAARWARLTPLERLQMLQQAKDFADRWLGAARKQPARKPAGKDQD